MTLYAVRYEESNIGAIVLGWNGPIIASTMYLKNGRIEVTPMGFLGVGRGVQTYENETDVNKFLQDAVNTAAGISSK